MNLCFIVTSIACFCLAAGFICPPNEALNCSSVEEVDSLTNKSGTPVRVGLLFPSKANTCTRISQSKQGVAAQIAVDDVNNSELLSDRWLELITIPEYRDCSKSWDTLGYAYYLKYQEDVDVIIGPACGHKTSGQSVASFATSEKVPVISVGSFIEALDYDPGIFRLSESLAIQATYHSEIYKYFGWKTVATITEKSRGLCTNKFENIPNLLSKDYKVTNYKYSGSDLTDKNENDASIKDILTKHRIISLLTSPFTARKLVQQAHTWCVDAGDKCNWSKYRFIHINFQIGAIVYNQRIEPWTCDQTCSTMLHYGKCTCCDENDKNTYDVDKIIYSNFIQIVTELPRATGDLKAFYCKFLRKSPKTGCIENSSLIQLIYDAVWVYANALNQTDTTNSTKIIKKLKNIDIEGKTGRIFGNIIGSRYSTAAAYYLLEENDPNMTKILEISPVQHNSKEFAVKALDAIKFVSNTPDRNQDGEKLIYILVSISVLAFIVIVLCFGYKLRIIRRYPDRSFMLSLEKLDRLRETERTKKVQSYYEQVMDVRIGPNDQTILDLLDELHVIHHSNILKLHHCSIQPNHLILFTDYCSKGSLHHLIQTEKKICDQLFIRSFALDIIKGLMYLHESKFGYHGYLNSMNCLVDARWNLKLSGFYKKNISRLLYSREDIFDNAHIEMCSMDNDEKIIKSLYENLWLSPECLNDEINDVEGHQLNDIYSLGVIISECLTGMGPFGITLNMDDERMGFRISNELNRIKSGETTYLVNDEVEVDAANDTKPEATSICSASAGNENVMSVVSSSDSNEMVEVGFSDSSDSVDRYSLLQFDANVMNDISKNVNRKISKVRFSVQDDKVSIVMSEISHLSARANSNSSSIPSTSSTFRKSPTNLSFPPIETSNSQTSFSSYQSKKQLMELFYACTATNLEDRPTLKWLRSELEDSISSTVIDQWFVLLEKRSAMLSKIFEDKNDDMRREKDKTQQLVYSLLPPEIAEQSRSGINVQPQKFSHCSFFYSDIKGFTSIVKELTEVSGKNAPLDVLDMLDNLYSIMDEAIAKHEVVKIETIGDAYVVVSGLPIANINGNRHAKEIARFALEVLSTTRNIVVPKLDNAPVKMRIGIHSGSCVAGIAGSTMFHYCIYGREPRYANNLESTGKALRIHMSDDMRLILDKHYPDEFVYMLRKNDHEFKSKKRTYWLIGERNNPRPMPDVDIYKKHVTSYKRKISNSSAVTPKFIPKF